MNVLRHPGQRELLKNYEDLCLFEDYYVLTRANNCAKYLNIQVGEMVEAQYNPVEDGQQLVEATEVTMQDSGKSSHFCTHTAFCSTYQPKTRG